MDLRRSCGVDSRSLLGPGPSSLRRVPFLFSHDPNLCLPRTDPELLGPSSRLTSRVDSIADPPIPTGKGGRRTPTLPPLSLRRGSSASGGPRPGWVRDESNRNCRRGGLEVGQGPHVRVVAAEPRTRGGGVDWSWSDSRPPVRGGLRCGPSSSTPVTTMPPGRSRTPTGDLGGTWLGRGVLVWKSIWGFGVPAPTSPLGSRRVLCHSDGEDGGWSKTDEWGPRCRCRTT